MTKFQERPTLKEAILNAARDMFIAGGLKNISIRAIAENIEHSVGTIYLYYQNKSALLMALRQDGLGKLSETFRTVSLGADPVDALKGICSAYMDFAIRNPQTYSLLFSPVLEVEEDVEEHLHPATFILNTIEEKISGCAEQGCLRFDDGQKASVMTMGILHGLASLFCMGDMDAICPNATSGDLQLILDDFLEIITKKI